MKEKKCQNDLLFPRSLRRYLGLLAFVCAIAAAVQILIIKQTGSEFTNIKGQLRVFCKGCVYFRSADGFYSVEKNITGGEVAEKTNINIHPHTGGLNRGAVEGS